MNELAELLPKYPRLRMSSIYWSGRFNVAAEHEHLIEDSRRILGYLKRFGSDRLTFGPPRPQVDGEKSPSPTKSAASLSRSSVSEPIFIRMSAA